MSGEFQSHEASAEERSPDNLGDLVCGEGRSEVADASSPSGEGVSEPPVPEGVRVPRLMGARKGRKMVKKGRGRGGVQVSPEQRLILLDTWQRSGLPAKDFGDLVGISKHTLYTWKQRFEEQGPAGLMDKQRGVGKGSRLNEVTKRAIVMMKQANPDWGCQRISDMLVRGPALYASPGAVVRVLKEAGYEVQEQTTSPHRDKVRRFERATANQMWQTDLFTFILKRQNARVYLVAFMDDHSRFITGWGLHASQSGTLVLEVLRAAIASYGTPREILTDNGTQYVTWRGKSRFAKELQKRGIQHIVAKPQRPQTLGKVERFWGTMWRECLEAAMFVDLGDARKRLGLFMDYYNFQRPHQGIEGLVPADRFFGAAPEVLKTLRERVAHNALELARGGIPKAPFYLTGRVGDKPVSVHSEGERVIVTGEGVERQEVDAQRPRGAALPEAVTAQGVVDSQLPEVEADAPPGSSPLDEGLKRLGETMGGGTTEEVRDEND